MSQEHNDSAKRPRRITRTQRNRPVLVTNNNTSATLDQEQPDSAAVAEPTTDGVSISEIATKQETGIRRRLGFFSTVGKSSEAPETDVAQARLARAIRGKTSKAPTAAESPKSASKTEEKKASRPAGRAPERPGSAFKTRYILGMGIYLLAANFIGAYEVQFMRSIHADTVLTSFNLFGGKVVINSSTLVFLATLITILILLAKFDLIPRSLTGVGGARSTKTTADKSQASSEPAPRYTPPAVRQGIKGTDDQLYQKYRANQRKKK